MIEIATTPRAPIPPGVMARYAKLPAAKREAVFKALAPEQRAAIATALKYTWQRHARHEQLPPADGNWDAFIMLGGRGGGKTRPAAEIVLDWSKDHPFIALMAKDAAAIRDVLIEGDSGLMACAPPWWKVNYNKGTMRLTFPNGAIALPLSAEAGADAARGRNFSCGWADDIVAWPRKAAAAAWNQGFLDAIRLGDRPRVVATTTAKPLELLIDICMGPKDSKTGHRPVRREQMALGSDGTVRWSYDLELKGRSYRTVVSRWKTERNNAALSPGFAEQRRARYGDGSLYAAQELDAELIVAVEGALWTSEQLEGWTRPDGSRGVRVEGVPVPIVRTVVAVDPTRARRPGDVAGIIAGGLGDDGHVYVWDDRSGKMAPEVWGQRALDMARLYGAESLVREKNRLEQSTKDLIRALDPKAKWIDVSASEGKRTRAEPVSALYALGKVHHVYDAADPEKLAALELEMCTWDQKDPEADSPGRMDALVWLVTALLLPESIHTPWRLS